MTDIYSYRGPGDPSAVGAFLLQRGQLTSAIGGGKVESASADSPVQITSTGHGLSTGATVTIEGIVGEDGANGRFTITKIDDDTFSLNGSTGTAGYTSGGTWSAWGRLIPHQWSVQDKKFVVSGGSTQYDAVPFLPTAESLPIGTIVGYFHRFGKAFVVSAQCPESV